MLVQALVPTTRLTPDALLAYDDPILIYAPPPAVAVGLVLSVFWCQVRVYCSMQPVCVCCRRAARDGSAPCVHTLRVNISELFRTSCGVQSRVAVPPDSPTVARTVCHTQWGTQCCASFRSHSGITSTLVDFRLRAWTGTRRVCQYLWRVLQVAALWCLLTAKASLFPAFFGCEHVRCGSVHWPHFPYLRCCLARAHVSRCASSGPRRIAR